MKKNDLWKQIGISLVSIGLGIGSGEFVLWPYLTYHWGFGLLWGALLGITLQIFLNIEIQRYALATGESLVHGAYKLSKHLGTWFIISTIIGFGWPGFAAGSAFLLSNVFSYTDNAGSTLSLVILCLAGLILILGKEVYSRIERILKVIVPISFLIITIIFILYFNMDLFKEMLAGLFGKGGFYNFIPKGLNLSLFLGAIAYAGSGGNLLLSQGYYVLEKRKFSDDFRKNRKFQIFENIFIFGGVGLFTILMLSYLGRTLTLPISAILNDLKFLPVQAAFISNMHGEWLGTLYLLTGVFALFAVQLGVLDLMGRVTKEIFALRFGKDSHQIYSFSVIIQVVFGALILLSGVNQPLWLIVTGSVFNALAMGVISFVTLMLGRKLHSKFRPGLITQIALLLVSIFLHWFLSYYCYIIRISGCSSDG